MKSGFYGDIEPVPQTKAGTQKTDLRTLIGKKDSVTVFSMRVITIAPGGFVGMHNHPYEHEIFVFKGNGRAKTETESVDMKPGDFLLVPPDVIHGFDNTGDDELEFICCIPIKE